MLRKIFDFFLFSSLFISLCAVVMVYQTYQLLIYEQPSATLLLFIFFSTVCSYNFHWWLTPTSVHSSQRIYWAQQHKGLHLFLYIIGLVACVIFFFLLRKHWLAIAFGGILTFLYSAPKIPLPYFRFLKQVAIGKTIFLTTVWTYVTAILPVFVSGLLHHYNHEMKWFAASRFFLIYAICIVFDFRDRADDKLEGIRTMVNYFDETGVNRLFIFSIIAFFIFTTILHFSGMSLITVLILMIPGIILFSIYNKAKYSVSDYLYYFVLDGLMMLSALLMAILSI